MAEIDQTSNSAFEICWARGDGDPKTFTITEASTPVDISGWSLRMAVSTEINPADISAQIFDVEGVFVTDGTDGRVSFTPTPGSLDAVSAPGVAFYDISRISPSKKTLIKGPVTFIQDIGKT